MTAKHEPKQEPKHDAGHSAAQTHDAHGKHTLHVKQSHPAHGGGATPADAADAAPAAAPADAAPAAAAKKGLLSGLGALFKRPKKVAQSAQAQKPLTDEQIIKHLRETRKPKRKKLTRQSLQQYLDKAGYEVNAERAKKVMFQSVIITFLVLTGVVLMLAAMNGAKTGHVIIFILGLWTAVFAGVLLLVWASVYFFLDYRIYRRTREVEEVLPDFLQLASSNIAAGMPVDRALWYAIRPNFGVLAKEMEEVAKSTMAGEDLETSLLRFTEKYDSVMLKRSINILIEGMHSGGEMADLLNKIALNIEEMKIMKKEMAANVTTYAIFITFASVVIAPFLFALATELLIIIMKITGSLQLDNSSLFTISPPDPEAITNFKMFSVAMLIVSTVFSACLVSIIKRGNVMEGIKTIPVYAVSAVFIYWLSSVLLHMMFGGII